MRKASQDGGDSSSITSGIENELKKSAAGIVKSKKNSIKRKVQSFSHESDDGVIEPLLQKEREKTETLTQSAKNLLSKTKTDIKNDKTGDKDKLLFQEKKEKTTLASFSGIADNVVNGTNGNYKSNGLETTAVQNYMNVNIFSSSDELKNIIPPKSQILVEIDGTKPSSYSSSPLIFTTAKIHTDGKTTHMEPVQVIPVPILSAVEGSFIKTSPLGETGKTTVGTLTVKSDTKKSDFNDPKLFGNNLKGFTTTSVYSTTTPVLTEISCDSNETKSVTNKTYNVSNTVASKLTDVMQLADIKKCETMTIKKTETSTENTASKSKLLMDINDCKVQHQNQEKHPVTCLKIDESKSFGSGSNDSKLSANAKKLAEDKSTKIINVSSRQIQHQKNALDDFEGMVKTKCSNTHPEIDTSVDTKSKSISIIGKHTAEINLPGKCTSPQNFTVATTIPTKSTISNSKISGSETSTLQSNVFSISNSVPKKVLGSQLTNVTTSTVAIAPALSNAKLTEATPSRVTTIGLHTPPTSAPVGFEKTSVSNKILSSNTYVTTSVTQSKIPIGVSVSCSESTEKTVPNIVLKEQLKSKPVSTNTFQNDKANTIKSKPIPTNSIIIAVTKSIPTVTTSSKVSKQAVLSSNKGNMASSTVSKSLSSPVTSNIKVLGNIKPIVSSSLPIGSNTDKTTSVLSQPGSSVSTSVKPVTTSVKSVTTTVKPVTTSVKPVTTSVKLTEATIGSQNSAIFKPNTTKNKSTADGLSLHTSGTKTKVQSVSSREHNVKTTAANESKRIKSPTTTAASTSAQKSSDSHKSQLQSNDSKKEKLK